MRARLFGLWLLMVFSTLCEAAPAVVQGVRLWAAPDNTRVVFDISGPVAHNLLTLAHPDRLVIDIPDARLTASLAHLDTRRGLVSGIRSAERHGNDLRVVLDLRRPVHPNSFLLKPNGPYGNRLVVDLHDPKAEAAEKAVATAPDSSRPRDLVIAIDPGHGGEDPGAHGPGGTLEKNVTLAIARRLAALVRKEPGMKPFLTRTGDYYVGLRERIQEAHRAKADLFVSIHADSAGRDHSVRGSTVYVLSERGASSEMARILAEHENAADLVGGVNLNDKGSMLKSVLLDLSQSASIEGSMQVARDVLHQLDRVGRIHRTKVQQAAFVVLKSPDIPSMLVETAFITNPHEERELRNPDHQEALAQAIMNGIRTYFYHNPPPGTVIAERAREQRLASSAGSHEHVVERGDTLSALAQRYQVSLKQLRSANNLTGSALQVGETLRIPTPDGEGS